MRTGIAQMPLHTGRAPAWLFSRMTLLAREIVRFIVEEQGPEDLLRRLSDPFWFQAFGCVLGFDWHSSGLTTTTCGALKEALRPIGREIGVYVCGGKGAASRKTPVEIAAACESCGQDAASLAHASRMAAKVDSAAVQDGYEIYHHSFVFTTSGRWCVVQQGMNETSRMARRYHWLSEKMDDFVCEPHAAVCCDVRGPTLNLVARESADSRAAIARLASEPPDKVIREASRVANLDLPARHAIIGACDIDPHRLRTALLATYEAHATQFSEILAVRGVGARTLRALSLIGEVIYGATPSFRDPARFSYAHGGKDGVPYPLDRETYDRSIEILRRAVNSARAGAYEKERAIRRLASIARCPQ